MRKIRKPQIFMAIPTIKYLELLHKQMNAQKESLKKLPGFTQAPTGPQKSVR